MPNDYNQGGLNMEKLFFRCTLLADAVISEHSATGGGHQTLDFIPGNNFLGIAASTIYHEDKPSRLIFHSGKVRFGDAHPLYDGVRSLRTPACFYYPKLSTLNDTCYIHHCIKNYKPLLPLQLKQCRKDFCTFSANQAHIIKVDKNFAIKSAYDRQLRRSADEKMFGYESIAKGTVFGFVVEIDDEAACYKQELVDSLIGNKHIGRSRSAQYGWVRIDLLAARQKFSESCSHADSGTEVAVYADGRLIFFDDNGMNTFQPSPANLGIHEEGAHIDWKRSQVRTFQYSPWNFKRQAFDNDRCGIEKGSVFVVILPSTSSIARSSAYVGAYQQEGFGKVIYNPDFLRTLPGKNGLSALTFHEAQQETPVLPQESSTANQELLRFLRHRKEKEQVKFDIYEQVNTFVNSNNLRKFKGERFASQWGTIRSIAISNRAEDICKRVDDYLSNGVAKDKWNELGRKELLLRTLRGIPDEYMKDFVINLSSEMAKKLKQSL